MIGPLPPSPSSSSTTSSAVADFERRSRKMRDRLEGKDKKEEPKREAWMLELPEERAKAFGLGNRQFSKSKGEKAVRDKSWTETPEQKRARLEGKVPEEVIKGVISLFTR